jgi:hypothetical protein
MQRQKPSFSILALIAANLAPLFGILFFGWDAAAIVLLYWIENLIIGAYNILMMILVKVKSQSAQFKKLFIIPFFCVHFGGFCAVHGFFLMAFFKLGDMDAFSPQSPWLGPLVFVQLLVSVVVQLWESRPPGMEWPVIGLVVSHGISFIRNYLIGGEYLTLSIGKLMSRPYRRIVLLHVAIIAGGAPIMMLGSPVPLLCILVILKIGVDIWLYTKSHKDTASEKRAEHFDQNAEPGAKKVPDI